MAAGRRVLELEAAEVAAAARRLDARFARAVELLAVRGGRVIVSGVGKSGLIARKLAATLTSTGTPATFLHPVDSLHGDLGIVGSEDVAIVLSKSGESSDLDGLLASLERKGVPIIAITGEPSSFLGRVATADARCLGRARRRVPHDLAPTSSTTVAMALGDALAVALLVEKGFRPEDFAELHPGGRLGRRLLLRVRDVMLPPQGLVSPETPMRDVIVQLARHRGIALVSGDGHLLGVFTAGDLTRLAEREHDYFEWPVEQVMTDTPHSCAARRLRRRGARLHGAEGHHGAAGARRGRHRRRGTPARPDARGGGMRIIARSGRQCWPACWAVAAVAACNDERCEAHVPWCRRSDSADQVLYGFVHYLTRDGVREGRDRGRYGVLLRPDTDHDTAQHEAGFIDSTGNENATITSRIGTYKWQTGDMIGRQQCGADRSHDGRVLKSGATVLRRHEEGAVDDAALHLRQARRVTSRAGIPVRPVVRARGGEEADRDGRQRRRCLPGQDARAQARANWRFDSARRTA